MGQNMRIGPTRPPGGGGTGSPGPKSLPKPPKPPDTSKQTNAAKASDKEAGSLGSHIITILVAIANIVGVTLFVGIVVGALYLILWAIMPINWPTEE